MPTESALDWLSCHFGEYDLIYLDPLACDPSLRRECVLQSLIHPEKRAIVSFLSKLARALKAQPGDENSTVFLSDTGPGGRLKGDRQLQRRVLVVIERYSKNRRIRHTENIRSLDKTFLEKVTDQPRGRSLLVLDAMFVGRSAAPKDIREATQIAPQLREGGARTSECMLADAPSQLLSLHHPVLPLLTDKQAFQGSPGELPLLLKVGWYPYVRAIGLHRTLPGGRSYFDVLALLMRPCPSLGEALLPRLGNPPNNSLVGALKFVESTWLEDEIRQLAAQYEPGANEPEFHLSVSEGEDRDTPNLQYLAPVLMFQLCCKMNHVSGQGLQRREPLAHRALQHYLDRLEELRGILRNHHAEHELVKTEARVELLLPSAPEE